MSLFFFHVHTCGVIREDAQGSDLPDFESATIRALRQARALMAAEVTMGRLCLDCHIEIEDRENDNRRVVRFEDALNIQGSIMRRAEERHP